MLRTDPAGLVDAVADPGPAEHYSPEGARRIVALADDFLVSHLVVGLGDQDDRGDDPNELGEALAAEVGLAVGDRLVGGRTVATDNGGAGAHVRLDPSHDAPAVFPAHPRPRVELTILPRLADGSASAGPPRAPAGRPPQTRALTPVGAVNRSWASVLTAAASSMSARTRTWRESNMVTPLASPQSPRDTV